MPDRPPHDPGSSVPADAARSLTDILDELSRITGVQHGEAAAMRSAVSELSGALASLFEMVRTDRAQQRATIAELEAALAEANARIRKLEAGEELAVPAPPPNDFGQLRDAAERLRQRTAELFRDAGTPLEQERAAQASGAQAGADADAGLPVGEEVPDHQLTPEQLAARDARIEAARKAVEASLAEAAAEAAAAEPEAPDAPPARPGVLRVFPGAGAAAAAFEPELQADDVVEEVEPRQAEAVAVALPVPAAPQPPVEDAQPAAGETTVDADADESAAPPPAAAWRQRNPIAVGPREARRRRGLRRRKVDARKLTGVDPASALRAMVAAIEPLWTSGAPVDLVIALTDGGAMHVTGGDVRPLEVRDVEPGTAARTTITVTSDQLVPLFGRLALTDAQSAPLIHGSRRDADLLVGWIDRAQRLTAEPL